MIRVRTGSRLHFGIFTLSTERERGTLWSNCEGEAVLPARRFGGVGLMVIDPSLAVCVESAPSWFATGPLAERALAFARQFTSTLPDCPPHRITVERCPREHVGLGTGTQLGLAVARALAASCGSDTLDAVELARRTGRGKRSALGVRGFERGGFLVEAGKRGSEAVAPLVVHADFPEEWRIVLILPSWDRGLHGENEVEALSHLQGNPRSLTETDVLCRLALLGMLPALAECDAETFGEALYDFNRRVGEMFRPVQGGAYSHPRTADLVAFLRQQGVRGVGQSSWGPAVFAVAADEDAAARLAAGAREHFDLGAEQVFITAAAAHGAITDAYPDPK